MEGVKKTRGCQFFSLKVGLVLAIVFIFGGAFYYNHHVILYRNQLNLLVSYLYDEVSPNQVGAVYQRMLNVDSDYRERIKNDLEPAMISRYQYYANLYMLRKIEYEEYLQYEQVIEPLFFSNDEVIETIGQVEKYYQSQRAYLKGFSLQQQGLIEEAIDSYQEVMFNDEYYYELAKTQRRECIQSIKNQYLTEANEYYEQKNYIEAIRRLDYLTQTDQDELVNALKWYYESEFYVEAIKTVDDSIKLLNDPRCEGLKILVLVNCPSDALKVVKAVSGIPYINVGNYGRVAPEKPGKPRKAYGNNIYCDDDEIQEFRELLATGLKCEYQTTPEEPVEDLAKVLK